MIPKKNNSLKKVLMFYSVVAMLICLLDFYSIFKFFSMFSALSSSDNIYINARNSVIIRFLISFALLCMYAGNLYLLTAKEKTTGRFVLFYLIIGFAGIVLFFAEPNFTEAFNALIMKSIHVNSKYIIFNGILIYLYRKRKTKEELTTIGDQ